MMIRDIRSAILLFALLSLLSCSSGKKAADAEAKPTHIKWLSVTDLDKLASEKSWKKESRMVVVDIYTDWCGWCKVMDRNTFSQSNIISYVSDNFYAVKLDAEMTDTIEFREKKYGFRGSGRRGAHELAIEWGMSNGGIGYPTIAFLDSTLKKVGTMPGYKDVTEMEAMLIYFKEGHYKSQNWPQWFTDYQKAKIPNQYAD